MIYIDGHLDQISDKYRIQFIEKASMWYYSIINGINVKLCNDNYVDIYYLVNYEDCTDNILN